MTQRRAVIVVLIVGIAVFAARISSHVDAQAVDAAAAAATDAFGPDNLNEESQGTAIRNDSRGLKWPSSGHDLSNTRNQPNERRISRSNANTLMVKWLFRPEGDIWTTPALDDRNRLYVPDSAGNLYAVDARTGAQIWAHKISEYTGIANDISRNTPAITRDALILGNQGGRQGAGAYVFAVNRNTGALLWSTKVDDHAASVVTQSPVVFRDSIFVGVSSLEEAWAASVAGYPCCGFRGSMLALNRRTGAVRWKTYTIPNGYSGGSVWGSTAVVDSRRNSVYVTTGNNYTVPPEILACQSGDPNAVKACVDAVPSWRDNHFDSVLALDMRSGAIKWSHVGVPFDSWNIACLLPSSAPNAVNCTVPSGEDFDFGQGATLYTVRMDGRSRDVVGAGQKSGKYWALNPDNGSVIWSTQVGPGGSLGGFEWASAYDGVRIYGAIANNRATPWTAPDGSVIPNGFWTALDPATGRILWQTPGNPAVRTTNQGAVTVANGVVYAGTIDRYGTMFALDAATGNTLWTFQSGGSVNTGPAIADGVAYWGSGYGVRGIGLSPSNRLYAFTLSADCQRSGTCTGGGGVGGGGGAGAGGGGGTGGGGPLPTTWSAIYAAYFGPGTSGHCSGCHDGSGRIVPLNSAATAYESLVSVGQINPANPTQSPIAVGPSRLTWLGGDMPPAGPTSNPDAVQAVKAWLAAGGLNN
jgi:polyvinyl alcohol dehydrogenase (cytochrome)